MDIQRQAKSVSRRHVVRVAFALVVISVAVVITLGLSRLKPALPKVERATILTGVVTRGQMVREVRGTGTLTANDARVVAAAAAGRVERVLVQPGGQVRADTVLIELSNPELEQAAADTQFQLLLAQDEYKNLRVKLESEQMGLEAAVATAQAEYKQAALQADTDQSLLDKGLIPAITAKLSRLKADELATRQTIAERQLNVGTRSAQAQTGAQETRIAQLRALSQLKQQQVGTLRVVAGTPGVIQQLQAEVGQQVTPGTNLARVVEPDNLKAELHIPEGQAKEVAVGQIVSIDTHNGVVAGRVARIDPAVQQGTVTVDVTLGERLPQGVRPDQSVDALIELQRLENVLYVERPAFGQADSETELFKLVDGGAGAARVRVKLGRGSANTVEVLEGLQESDQVILSDTSAWNSLERIRLE
ncbi:MAG TPA: efflux RND transporter periplasmic adaptor subunit [Pyrinomonadaceae bacterium]